MCVGIIKVWGSSLGSRRNLHIGFIMSCRWGFSRKMQKTGGVGENRPPPLMKLGLNFLTCALCIYQVRVNGGGEKESPNLIWSCLFKKNLKSFYSKNEGKKFNPPPNKKSLLGLSSYIGQLINLIPLFSIWPHILHIFNVFFSIFKENHSYYFF